MSLIPVENHAELFGDSKTGAIVNKSTSDFQRYNNTRNKMLSKEERINDLEQKVDNLSSDIGDIKSMLQSFLSNNNGQ